jgi:asparagine synthetase B (glutamine-hydrolysing)
VTKQPVEFDSKFFMLMGEIYDWDDKHDSDAFHVVEMYRRYGNLFTKHLDGEFLIVIIDKKEHTIDFFSDPWGTRQCWFDLDGDKFYFGTFPRIEPEFDRFDVKDIIYGYDSTIRLKPNSHYQFDIQSKRLDLINESLHEWQFEQYKNTFDDWDLAFRDAVLKRTHSDQILFFSGGLDSAAIAMVLAEERIPFTALHLNYRDIEDEESLRQIVEYCQPYMNFVIVRDREFPKSKTRNMLERRSIHNHAIIPLLERSKMLDAKVILSGHGGDETISNYAHKLRTPGDPRKDHSFTSWPEDLKTVFPWKHFYDGQNRRIIDKNEFLSLSYGIEIRNVFLDKVLAQEWMSLNQNLKNLCHKPPLHNFFTMRGIKVPDRSASMARQEDGKE